MVLSVHLAESYRNDCSKWPFPRKLETTLLEKWHGINPIFLIATLADYKKKQFFTSTKISPTTLILNKNIRKGLTQLAFVSLEMTLIYTNEKTKQILTWNPDYFSLKTLKRTTKVLQLIKPIGLCAPWPKYYIHNWRYPTNLNHQTLITFSGKI